VQKPIYTLNAEPLSNMTTRFTLKIWIFELVSAGKS